MKFGQYELLERIAIGGMAEVYKGRVVGAEGFEKLVAIKRIQPDLIADERFVTMLLTEARIHSALSHRNIVQIHDLGISEEGEYFIVLEYVEGYDLRAIMESITSDGEIIPEALSLHIAAEVAQGLHFAHELLGPDRQPLGLIHRDVSPSNVLISFAGEVKLSDFGLAKRRHDRSVVGSLKGNLIYMSPEQARQAPLDRRTDVFSLGALLFELLTGKRLREITDEIKGWGEVAAGVVRSARSARPDLPPSFEALLNQALAAEPGRRFPDAATFGAAIRQLLSQMNTPVGPADLQVLLGLVKPPKRPRGELDRSKVIRLGPDAHRTRTAAPALPPLSGRIAEPSPLDRLRSAQARTAPSAPLRRSPAVPARTKSNDELDAYPPTPPAGAGHVGAATARVADAATSIGGHFRRSRERCWAQHLGRRFLAVQRGSACRPRRDGALRRSDRRWSDLRPRPRNARPVQRARGPGESPDDAARSGDAARPDRVAAAHRDRARDGAYVAAASRQSRAGAAPARDGQDTAVAARGFSGDAAADARTDAAAAAAPRLDQPPDAASRHGGRARSDATAGRGSRAARVGAVRTDVAAGRIVAPPAAAQRPARVTATVAARSCQCFRSASGDRSRSVSPQYW